MGEAFFLKKKNRQLPKGLARAPAAASSPKPRPRPPARPAPPKPDAAATAAAEAAKVKAEPNPNIIEIQIVSAEPGSGRRYNLMKLNSQKEIDPSKIPQPILLNRKQPGPKQPPQFATDEEGKIIGRYVYDEEGKPVLDDEGKPVVEKRTEMDMSLVGTAPGQSGKRRGKRNVKEVFHQDIDVIKLRREEAHPWVLEAKNPTPNPPVPEYWVGRMMEQATLPTVLLINEGEGSTFTMVPLGRTYKFEAKRPFEVMDSDQANKYFEMQAKYKVHNRWGQRQENAGPSGSGSAVKVEPQGLHPLEDRAQRMEWNIRANKDEERSRGRRMMMGPPRAGGDRYEDDFDREGRGRKMESEMDGGVDEELDFDVNEEFQDDEDSNTFYHNKEEDDEKKIQEERQKMEYRWANANVGDRPQLEDGDDDDDDLFGDKLTSEGKKLRKMMRKREEDGDLYESTDDDDDSSDSDTEDGKDKDKDKAPGSAERPSRSGSRAGSRPPGDRGSPSRRLQPPTPDRAGTAPPGAGAALLAKRAASRGASPSRSRSRAGSPLVRGASPDGRGSPGPDGRATSPTLGRSGSPGATSAAGTPGASRPKSKSAKRKASSESPLRDSAPTGSTNGPSGLSQSNKRKTPEDSATPSDRAGSPAVDGQKKKKKRSSGSATPVPEESFPGMIQRQQVLDWLLSQPQELIPMSTAIHAFATQIREAGPANSTRNQAVFLHYIRELTDKEEGKKLRVKPQFYSA